MVPIKSVKPKTMKKLIFMLLCLSVGEHAQAQAPEKETIRVKSPDGKGTSISVLDKYIYPQFSMGTVNYWNGQTPSARLNYNLLLKEMQFLSPTGDTLTLDQEQTIQKVAVNGEVFVFDQKHGFLKIMGDYGNAKLVLSQFLQIASLDKQGGYGQSSGVSSIKTYSSFSNGNSSISHLSINGDVVYSKNKTYLLLDQNNRVYPVSKRNVMRVYPRQKKAIEEYLHTNQVRFNEPKELQRLLEFCNNEAN